MLLHTLHKQIEYFAQLLKNILLNIKYYQNLRCLCSSLHSLVFSLVLSPPSLSSSSLLSSSSRSNTNMAKLFKTPAATVILKLVTTSHSSLTLRRISLVQLITHSDQSARRLTLQAVDSLMKDPAAPAPRLEIMIEHILLTIIIILGIIGVLRLDRQGYLSQHATMFTAGLHSYQETARRVSSDLYQCVCSVK